MTLLVAVSASAAMTVASAADECFSPATHYNICEAAAKIQRELAKALPMPINSNVTLHSVLVFGPRLSLNAVWAQSNAEMITILEAGGMTKAQLVEKVAVAARSMVCGQSTTGAFVRLGGRVEYNYRTSDIVPVATALVDDCPQP